MQVVTINSGFLSQARSVPRTQSELVDYFLETESGEMQYEMARMRPLLSDDFFSFLAKQISESFNLPWSVLSTYCPIVRLAWQSSFRISKTEQGCIERDQNDFSPSSTLVQQYWIFASSLHGLWKICVPYVMV